MDTNTNGFYYSSDYQGRKGPYVIIVIVIFLCLMLGSSFKNDKPVDDYYGPYDSDNVSNNVDSDIQDNVNSNNSTNSADDTSSVDDNTSSHNMFEYYQGGN